MTNFDREIVEYAEINEFDQYVDKECTFDTYGNVIREDTLIYNKYNGYYFSDQQIFDKKSIFSETFCIPNFHALFNNPYKHD